MHNTDQALSMEAAVSPWFFAPMLNNIMQSI
jgi:hypothetical protein